MAALGDLINQNCERFAHQDDATVAWRVLRDINGMTDEARTMLLPLVTAEVGRARRSSVRTVERHVFAHSSRRRPVVVTGRITPELRQLANRAFRLGDGTETSWGTATRAQHQQRIAWYERHIAGCEQTLAHHREVLAALEAAGAECLNDLIEGLAA